MIFKIGYESFGEGEMVVNTDYLYECENIADLVDLDTSLKNYIFEKIEEKGSINKDDIFDWYNSDEDIPTYCAEADSKEEFLKNCTTLEQLKEQFVEPDTIFIFRNYQHSKNVLLAKFIGFKSTQNVKDFCINKELNYSEFQGGQHSIYEFNNCYFKCSDENFDLEDIEAMRSSETADVYTLE